MVSGRLCGHDPIDVLKEDISDNFEAFVWEPAIVRINAITAASEAACLVLSIDETVQNPKSDMSGDDWGGKALMIHYYDDGNWDEPELAILIN